MTFNFCSALYSISAQSIQNKIQIETMLLIIAENEIPKSPTSWLTLLKQSYFKARAMTQAHALPSAHAYFNSESTILYFLGLELLLPGLGLGKGFGVGLDTYKTIFMKVSSAHVAQRISGWTFNPVDGGTIPARGQFFFYI